MGHIEVAPSHAPTCPPSSSSRRPRRGAGRAWPCASSLRWRCARRQAPPLPSTRSHPILLLLDMNFAPGASDGAVAGLLHEVLARRDAPAVIVMTAYAEVELAVQALKAGAVDFIRKPWRNERLEACVQAALARRAPAPPVADELLGESSVMRSLRAQIAQVGASQKPASSSPARTAWARLVARALHRACRRAPEPIVGGGHGLAARGAGGRASSLATGAAASPMRASRARAASWRRRAARSCSTDRQPAAGPTSQAAGRAGAPRGDAAGQRQAAARRCARAGRHQPARGRAVRCQALPARPALPPQHRGAARAAAARARGWRRGAAAAALPRTSRVASPARDRARPWLD